MSVTKEEAIKELKELQTMRDPESSHMRADGILCELLEELGYADVVREYECIDMWYA